MRIHKPLKKPKEAYRSNLHAHARGEEKRQTFAWRAEEAAGTHGQRNLQEKK
jgi:hypothetical protein